MQDAYKTISDDNIITVSHVINPNKFYIRYNTDIQRDNINKLQIELEMTKYFSAQRLPERKYMPKENEVSCLYNVFLDLLFRPFELCKLELKFL